MKVLFARLTISALAFAQTALAADLYVATNATGDGSGSSWANATNSLQGAIDAIAGTYRTNTVWVSNGVYEVGGQTNYPSSAVLTNRVAIYKAITVRSANNDPTNTIIKGTWNPDTTNGPAAVRCVYMTNGSSLIGFMLTNGATLSTNESLSVSNICGGGVWCQSTNTVISNCVIAGNTASFDGGGAYYGTLYNCTLTGNKYIRTAATGGGGGGSANGTLYNCTLTGNYSSYTGGGAMVGKLYNCTLTGNLGNYGGGASSCTLSNCILTGNSAFAQYGGGGGSGGTLYNCMIANNYATAPGYGGGWKYGTLYNCTIVSNSGTWGGGGVDYSILYNCISWSNKQADFRHTAYYSCGVGYTNGGSVSGNITNNPLFVDSGAGNWHLSKDSPCINTGTNQNWMTNATDLDGRGRIRYETVDMGAYEYIYEGTIYSSR